MKVKISYTVNIDDEFRKAINNYAGYSGLASRERIKKWFENYGHSMNDDLKVEYQNELNNQFIFISEK